MAKIEKKPLSDTLVINGNAQNALRIVFTIKGNTPAYKQTYTRRGKQKEKIGYATAEHLLWLQAHKDDYAKGYQFGKETLEGEAVVTINVQDLYRLGLQAARNTNKTSKLGPARAKFTGNRVFTEG